MFLREAVHIFQLTLSNAEAPLEGLALGYCFWRLEAEVLLHTLLDVNDSLQVLSLLDRDLCLELLILVGWVNLLDSVPAHII